MKIQEEEEDDCSFRATFCPKRYPKSVAPEYRLFQSWDTVQQMTKLVNKYVGQLAWCGFHGVGQPSASVSRAVLFTFSRGLCRHKVSMLCTTPRAALWFSAYVKIFRTLGGTLEAISVITEILAFQANSIFILWAAGILGAMASAMNDATRACILQHFSKEKNNHDVTLKDNNQDSAGGFVGVLGGLLLVYLLGSEFDRHSGSLVMAATSCFCLCCIHAATNLASAMVLKISPATFTLQHCKTRRFVTLTSGNTLAATADTAKAGNVEIFRLPSDQIPGKALMSVDGLWFDQDGMVIDHPVASELEEDGQTVRLRDERYDLGPCTRLPSSSKASSGVFFPPGWPTSMPDGYDEYLAYELVVSIVATPMSLLHYFIFWKYVAGVGDSTKSPAFACFLMLYLDFVGLLCGLISGLPKFAKRYDHRWLCLGYFLSAFAEGTVIVAQVCPLPWYLLLTGLVQPFKSLAGVAGKTVSAELERRFASHPNVDLIHLKSCKRNRDTVLNLLSSILCVCYALHMYKCSIDPSLPGMIVTFFMLLFFKLAADYKKSQVAARVLTSDQASGSYDLIEDEASHQPLRMDSPQVTEQVPSVPTHRFTAKKFGFTLLLAGARVTTNVPLQRMNLDPPATDSRQIEILAQGLPLWHGAQIAADVTLVSPIGRTGLVRHSAATSPGDAILHATRRKRDVTYPEFASSRRCRLAVWGLEVGGRWGHEAIELLRSLAWARARAAPPALRRAAASAYIRRWAALIAFAAPGLGPRTFNEREDYPVVVFHDGLSKASRQRILEASPNRIWFAYVVGYKSVPAYLADRMELQLGGYGVGYRGMCRFRSGPIFMQPVMQGFDYAWTLDTDGYFPADLSRDPVER
eukprot:s1972_g6.t2